MKSILSTTLVAVLGLALGSQAFAQKALEGVTWQKIEDPDFVLQLERVEDRKKNYETIAWKDIQSDVEYAKNYCKYTVTNKTGDYSTATHKFTLTADKRGMRSEMKVQYKAAYKDDGIYQFEGEVRFTPHTASPNHICQIWQNMKQTRNKILIFNTKTDDGGTLVVPPNAERVGTFRPLTGIYEKYNAANGRWLKVNVIHVRAERKVYIYLGKDGELYDEYVHGETDGPYYFKFGAYGRIDHLPLQDAVVEWRHVKMFEGRKNAVAAQH